MHFPARKNWQTCEEAARDAAEALIRGSVVVASSDGLTPLALRLLGVSKNDKPESTGLCRVTRSRECLVECRAAHRRPQFVLVVSEWTFTSVLAGALEIEAAHRPAP